MQTNRATLLTLASCFALMASPSRAQSAPKPTTEADEETVTLSPFIVDASNDADSYLATATLGGSRVRTDLKDLPSSISVVTSKFLRDVGATDNQTLLQYVTNAEVGGLGGNYSGVGNTLVNGVSENMATLVRPNSNTRVRGLDSADNTQDYFQTEVPWDSYNVDRVEVQRGPNSILFGVGSPAGIINTSTIQAGFKNGGKAENRIGEYGSLRNSFDYNYVLLPHELSLRIAALHDRENYQQKPAFSLDRRVFGTLRYDPHWLETDNAHTTVRASFESGSVNANRPRTLPPFDNITPFFYTSANAVKGENLINGRVFDPYYAAQNNLIGWQSGPNNIAWLGAYMPGLEGTYNPVFAYNANSSSPIRAPFQAVPGTVGALGVDTGNSNKVITDNAIGGFPWARPLGIIGYSEHAKLVGLNGADRGYYKDRTLSDPSIFDFFNQLIDGPNKREWQRWKTFTGSIDQTFADGRLAFQLAYNHEEYSDGYRRNLGWAPSLSIDLNQYTLDYPAYAFPAQAVLNPNVGRAYVGSNAQNQGAENTVKRSYVRAMANAELRADDVLQKGSLAAHLLGRHQFTALYSSEDQKNDSRTFAPVALGVDYAEAIGYGPSGTNQYRISDGSRDPDFITYLSPDLRGRTSESGLDLPNITAVQSPTGSAGVNYFSTKWTPPAGVNPTDPWVNPTATAGTSPNTFQTENPLNYQGWTNKSFEVLNSDSGDTTQLYADHSKLARKIDSLALTWQGHLADDLIVPIYGWRRDKLTLASQDAVTDVSTGAASTNEFISHDPKSISGQSRTWGVVMHLPPKWTATLPGQPTLSFIYNDSNNTRVETRYAFSGQPLPDAQGHSRDYGIAISTFNDRLRFKVTRYESEVKNANLGGGEQGTLGSNTYYLYLQEAWGAARAASNLIGMAGKSPGYEWAWDWALVDNGWDSKYNDPNGAAFLNAPQTAQEIAASKDWLATMPKQSFFDAYGIPLNVSKLQSGDVNTMLSAFPAGYASNPDIGTIQAAGKGRINGVYPTGTIDTKSKGWEFELVGDVTKNWNISVNASKTFASRGDVGKELSDWIQQTYTRLQGPAGDLRLWWAGDSGVGNMRNRFLSTIWAPYLFQVDSKGLMVPEMSPWRTNIVTNYNIDHGALKGVHFGAGYRWQQGVILGYALTSYADPANATQTEYKLDPTKPYWGKSQDAVDLWVGYGRRIAHNLDWHVQLNLRNVGQKTRLIPISVEPDGSTAASRIEEGMTWTLTNTFSF